LQCALNNRAHQIAPVFGRRLRVLERIDRGSGRFGGGGEDSITWRRAAR
jgi:hypothetical protein